MKINFGLTVFIAVLFFIIGGIYTDIDKQMPGYTINIGHAFVALVLMSACFAFGFIAAKGDE